VRPDPTVGNITQYESIGRSDSDRVTFTANYRIPRKAIFFGGNYTIGRAMNDFDSATSLPQDSLHLENEWGPSRQDIRHRAQGQFNMPVVWGIRANANVNAQSGVPYTITTGLDTNKDGLVNERPLGMKRNQAHGEATWTVNLRVQKQFGLGGPAAGTGGGFPGGGGGRPGGTVGNQRGPEGGGGGNRGGGGGGNNGNGNSRYNMELFVSADNVLNNVNYGGYSGSMLSPYFLQPTSAQAARRVQLGMGFRF
jgi:hypothetical protein